MDSTKVEKTQKKTKRWTHNKGQNPIENEKMDWTKVEKTQKKTKRRPSFDLT
jgi:hypothetical protein